jgi:hypothetical protein
VLWSTPDGLIFVARQRILLSRVTGFAVPE